eukprot:COSAG05_NODE_4503_length_1487_cov_1.832853_3_plen_76_part_00
MGVADLESRYRLLGAAGQPVFTRTRFLNQRALERAGKPLREVSADHSQTNTLSGQAERGVVGNLAVLHGDQLADD